MGYYYQPDNVGMRRTPEDQATLAPAFFQAFFSASVAGRSAFPGERRWVAVVLRWAAEACFLKAPEQSLPGGFGE